MKSQQGRGEGRNRTTARIFVCNQRHRDVLELLFLAPAKGTEFDFWLFAPCPSGWKLPGINGLRVLQGATKGDRESCRPGWHCHPLTLAPSRFPEKENPAGVSSRQMLIRNSCLASPSSLMPLITRWGPQLHSPPPRISKSWRELKELPWDFPRMAEQCRANVPRVSAHLCA